MKKSLWIIVFLSLVSATSFNQFNLTNLPQKNIRDGETIITNDDLSYIRPALHFYQYGIWKDEFKGDLSFFLRSPGYGTIYYISKVIHPNNPLLFIKIIQIFLFTISVYCLYYIVLFATKKELFSLLCTALYGIFPIAINFLFYTLTEGITPALFIFFIFFLIKTLQQHQINYQIIFISIATLFFAVLFVTRPVLGIFIGLIPLTIFLSFKSVTKKITYSTIFMLCGYSLVGFWQIRNYNIAKQYIGLHPIYYSDNNSIYRPPFKAFWNFALGWAEDGATVHNYLLPFWQYTINGDTSKTHINNIINQFPEYVQQHFGKQRLTDALTTYQNSIIYQKQFYDKGLTMPSQKIELETKSVQQLEKLTTEFKKDFWFTYYIISPFKVYAKLGFHSNLSSYFFQVKYRGHFLVETLRLISLFIHCSSFIAIIAILFFYKKNHPFIFYVYVSTLIYLFYLSYFQRGIEERYTLPVLPILLTSLIHISSILTSLFQEKKLFKKSVNTV